MLQLKKWTLRILPAILALALVFTGIMMIPERNAAADEEEMEIVDSYPYDTVTRDSVNLRASRSIKSELLKKIPKGKEITVYGVKGDWAEVTYGKYSGYVKTEYIVLKKVQKIKATPTPTPVPTLSPEEDAGGYIILSLGSSGSEVRALQEALIELGYLSGTADGKFGEGTQKAVIAFQQKNNYPDTGLMDANIQAFLYSGSPKNSQGIATKIKTLAPVEGAIMRLGNKGEAVEKIQKRLQELGYYTGNITGTYDTTTRAAVTAFQKKNGLKADGAAGADTQKAVYSENALSVASTPTPKPTAEPTATPEPTPAPTYKIPTATVKSGSEGNDAKTVQRRLKELGYYSGKTDGIFGKGSVDALERFQKANGLIPDGKAGKTTYAILFSSKAKTAAEAEPTQEPDATATPAPTAEPTANVSIQWTTLRSGDSGQAVTQLQEMLIQLGYMSGKADGKYGSKTVDAVKAFQKANGLKTDGVAGEATQKKMFGEDAKAAENKATPTPKASATPTPTATAKTANSSGTLREGDRGDDVRELQRQLIKLGYLSGSADGIFGKKTTAAVIAFQKANKLEADGIAGSKTQDKLSGATADSSASSSTSTTTTNPTGTVVGKPSASKVIYANWYTTVKSVCRNYPYATVYDYQTGISWQVHIFSVGAHADYEPLTANDTAKMLKVFGGTTWNPRAVWVIFADGSVYMASTHSNPHGTSHTKDNNFDGHSCLHFPRTQEQVEAIGPYATNHQDIIDKAATQAMK